MPYKAIVFDFFGVICSEVAPQWLLHHLETEEKARAIKTEIVGAADRGDRRQRREHHRRPSAGARTPHLQLPRALP